MSLPKRFASSLALLVLALPLSGTPPLGGLLGERLSEDLAIEDLGDVRSGLRVSPDGAWFLYRADGEVEDRVEVYVGPSDLGSSPLRLNADIFAGTQVRRAEFTPDSSLVVYEVGLLSFLDGFALYSVPTDGSQPPATLTPAGVGIIRDWEISPDSSCVVLDTVDDAGPNLYSVPVDGTGPATVLTPPPMQSHAWLSQRFAISPDSSFVVYRDDCDIGAFGVCIELYRVPITGGTPLRVSQALTVPNTINRFQLSPDGAWIVYSGDALTDQVIELFSVPSDGSGSPVRLNDPFVAEGDLVEYRIDANSAHVVFSADANVDEFVELFTVPIAGGTPVPLAPQAPSSVFTDFDIDPTGARILYRESDGQGELYSTPIDGSGPAVKLNGPIGTFGGVLWPVSVSPDGSQVAYRMRSDTDTFQWLLEIAPTDGSAPALILDTFPWQPQTGFQFLPDGSRIAFRALEGSLQILASMNTIRTDGTDWFTLSAQAFGSNGSVEEFVPIPDSSAVFFHGDLYVDDVFHVHRAPVDAGGSSTTATGPLAPGDVAGEVFNWRVSPDSQWTLYQADQDTDEAFELYTVPTDASSPPLKLNAALPDGGSAFFDFFPTGDSARVVYRADQDVLGTAELYSTAIDGAGLPTKLSPPMGNGGDVEGLALAPDGSTVVYLADQDVDGESELYSVPADGSSAAVQINAALVAGGDVLDFVFTPAGDQVVYRAAQDTPLQAELYVAAIDGSGPGTKLSGSIVPDGDVAAHYEASPSGRTVFLADADSDGVQEIYSAPTDASQPPVRLNDSLPAFADVFDFAIAEDPGLVVYYADALVDQQGDLFSVPIDGSGPPVHLNGALPANGDVAEFEVTADGTRVVYRADANTDNVFELFSAPTDGSAPPIRISHALTGLRDVVGAVGWRPFAITSSSKRVVFRADAGQDEYFQLYSVPIDGATPPVRISATPNNSRDVRGFLVGTDNRVLYEADRDGAGEVAVWLVRATGLGPTQRICPNLPSFGDVRSTLYATPNFGFTPDGTQVHYVADQLQDSVFELFTTEVGPKPPGGRQKKEAPGPVLDGGAVEGPQAFSAGRSGLPGERRRAESELPPRLRRFIAPEPPQRSAAAVFWENPGEADGEPRW